MISPDPAPEVEPARLVKTFPRFLAAGIVNTGLTYILYLGLLLLFPYGWAYSITYAAGILLGYLMNAYWVFGRKPGMRSAAAYPLGYLLNYLMGLGLLWLLIEKLGIAQEYAPLAVVAVTTPAMYLATRLVFGLEKKQ